MNEKIEKKKNCRRSSKKLFKDNEEHLDKLEVREVLDMSGSSNQRVHVSVLDMKNDIDS